MFSGAFFCGVAKMVASVSAKGTDRGGGRGSRGAAERWRSANRLLLGVARTIPPSAGECDRDRSLRRGGGVAATADEGNWLEPAVFLGIRKLSVSLNSSGAKISTLRFLGVTVT